MGQLIYIKLKSTDDTVINDLNKVLDELKIKNQFITNQMNENWLHDINAGIKGHGHLKPEGRDLTMPELLDMFDIWTEVGLLSFNVAFSRTSQALAKKYAKFITANVNSIEYLKGADELITRYNLTSKEISCINALNKPYEEPELLPVEEQHIPNLQSGLFLCKSFSPNPFWVIFGKVDRPTFLKVRKYKDDLYNILYRDKKNLGYLMLPLLPINNRQSEFVQEVYEYAYGMGLREHYAFIIPYVYGLDIINYNEVAEDYKEFYSTEELRERFIMLFKQLAAKGYANYESIVYSISRKKFVPTGAQGTHPNDAKCSVLTCLSRAIGADETAKLVSEITGRKYLPIEFK